MPVKYCELNDKVAIVTGASRGTGKAIAIQLAKCGSKLVLVARNAEALVSVKEYINSQGGNAVAMSGDISSLNSFAEIIANTVSKWERIDILVNNAGTARDNIIMRMKEEDWGRVLAVNLKGSFLCGQQAAKHMMKQRQGAIVNIASIVGVMGNAGQANYSASKAGLIGLTKTMARELAPRNITVNAIAPGFIDTEMTRVLDEKIRDKLIEQIPLSRLGLPDDIAHSVAFLVSGRSSYITGQVINVNGGMLM